MKVGVNIDWKALYKNDSLGPYQQWWCDNG